MTLLFSIHTLNLVFLPRSSGGASPPSLKAQEGVRTHRAPLIRAWERYLGQGFSNVLQFSLQFKSG